MTIKAIVDGVVRAVMEGGDMKNDGWLDQPSFFNTLYIEVL